MRLNSNQHVEVLVVSSVLNEVLQSIAAFEKNGTFSALVRIEVESESRQVPELADGQQPRHEEDELTDGDEEPDGQQSHLFIEIVRLQGARERHQVPELFVAHQNKEQDGVARESRKSERQLARLSGFFRSNFTRCVQHDAEHSTKRLPAEDEVSCEFENKRQPNDGDVEGEVE